MRQRRDIFLPSQAEIQRECLRLQEVWSNRERQKRGGSKPQPWTVPIIETAIILQNMAALSSD
jgi:hypothetical protein